MLASLPSAAGAQAPPTVAGAEVELVRVDAVVHDKAGQPVVGLRADDFELFAGGRRQPITHFEYVVTAPLGQEATSSERPDPGPLLSTGALRRAHRTMAIVVDDLSLAFESLVRTRKMLADLVDAQLGPTDVAAIVRTGGGIGNLQQFTSDKRLLKAAARGVPYNLARRSVEVASDNDGMRAFEREYRVHRSMGAIGTLESVVGALTRMPGRKSLVFVSEGLASRDSQDDTSRIEARIRDLSETLNRAAVVFYALDPSGLQTLLPTAASGGGEGLPATQAQREVRASLVQLADDTGGLTLFDSNDLGGLVDRVFEDQRGYYLLGYQPEGPDRGGKARDRLHRLSLKVKPEGLRVRSRRAFAMGAEEGRGGARPRAMTFADALLSPFEAVEVPIKLTALFSSDGKGPSIRCLVYIDARELTLRDGEDGQRVAEVEAGALSVDARGRLGRKAGGRYTLRLTEGTASAAHERGLVLTLDLPVAAGPHQVRAAVRDLASGRAGSAAQFLEVPDLLKRRLAVSGIVLSGDEADHGDESIDANATSAVRRFKPGSAVRYAFRVYNGKLDPEGRQPRIAARLALYREGERLETIGIADDAPRLFAEGRLAIGGVLRLRGDMPAGTYALAVEAEDALRPEGDPGRRAVQSIDFSVAGS